MFIPKGEVIILTVSVSLVENTFVQDVLQIKKE